MLLPRRLLSVFAVLAGGALVGGPVPAANAQSSALPLKLEAGPTTVGASVGPTQTSPVLGQVGFLMSNNLTLIEPPSPLVVYKRPSGCLATPAAQGDRLAHNIYNQTNVDVQTYFDPYCTVPAPLRVRANQGSHVDYVIQSFRAIAPVDTNVAVAGQNVGVSVAPSTALVAPVTMYVIETQPMVNFDPPPPGCQSITYFIPQFAPHSMLNNGTGMLRLFEAPGCQGAAKEVGPGEVAHLGASQSWNYSSAATATRASARTARISANAACARAVSRKQGRRATKRSTRAARARSSAARKCRTVRRTAATAKKAAASKHRHR